MGKRSSFAGTSQFDASPLQHSAQDEVDSKVTTVAESLAHGPYRQTSTPIIVPTRRKHPHPMRLEQLQQQEEAEEEDALDDLRLLFRDPRFAS